MRFRRRAGFGKRIEFSIIAQMIEEGLDIYMPLVDDKGIDVVVRRDGGCYVEVQIKARSKEAKAVAQFSVRSHELRQNYWFVFYSEQLKKKWIMNSTEFIKGSREIKRGKYPGLRWIVFSDTPRFQQYVAEDFSRSAKEQPTPTVTA